MHRPFLLLAALAAAALAIPGCQSSAPQLAELRDELARTRADLERCRSRAHCVPPGGEVVSLLPAAPLARCGRSRGGVLRAGPSLDSERLGVLAAGEAIELLARHAAQREGYHWFAVRTADRRQGYQWGGLLCSCGADYIGAYARCAR